MTAALAAAALILATPHRYYLRLRKWILFSKCDTCVKFREELPQAKDPLEQRRVSKAHGEHVEAILGDRARYWAHRHMTEMYPEQYMSVIIDGMGTKEASLPRCSSRQGNHHPT